MIQSVTYQQLFAPMAESGALKPLYASPTGFKAHLGDASRTKWAADICLCRGQCVIKDPPADDRAGTVLETPSSVHSFLAINGPVTDCTAWLTRSYQRRSTRMTSRSGFRQLARPDSSDPAILKQRPAR